ncbi:DNA-binding transcriptional regulator, LysR family [Microbulbifer donghaiensis]|uniref:DNA-binding transcriptional regulator, LysR family n=1 Tax=Microbulbifer donghaiensis TaxID=494016 RepID=A0A1M4ZMX4_9GAMM|nr:LysR substrate-binding domain-containing protein [Microbulbifer donghaiensis]SHF19358.1 DNA-binding transcriptional regulator, LysR family [Microbulbifer donghaiensis]
MYDRLSNLNSIRVFEAAARLGSFKDAAGELHITPTAVSHQIRNLEAQLDTALFERRTRAVYLTAAGRQLADAARLSLQTLADAIEEISGQPKVLTVNTTSAFAALWLAPRLQDFYRGHPQLRVVVQTDEQLVDLQRDRRVDIAIRYGLPPAEGGAELLLREDFGIYGTADSLAKLEKGRPITLFETQWKSRSLPAVTAEQWWRRFMPRRKMPAQYRFDQEMYVIQAALAGQGLAFVSNLLADSAVQQGWLRRYRGSCRLPGFGYYLLCGDRGQQQKVEAFRSWLKNDLPAAPGLGGK